MPVLPSPPLFHGKAVLVEFSPAVRNPSIILASIRGLVRRMDAANAHEDVLLIRIHDLVAEYDGLSAQLLGRTPQAIRLGVSRQ